MNLSINTPFTQISCLQRGPAFHITIERAKEHNTMTDVVMKEMQQALMLAEQTNGVRAIVITGAGEQSFCAGGKLKPTADGSPFALDPGRFDNPVAELFRAIDRSNLPIIARVNGSAFGGGVGLVCACDFAVAVDTAKFGTTEAKVGVFPLMILPLLMRVISRRRLQEMCFFAERFDAHQACKLEIVNQVVGASELDAAVDALVAKLVLNSPVALRMGRRAFSALNDLSLNDALNLAQMILPIMSQSEDAKEGMKAFAEKRPAQWPNC
jgi:enoyl-CoA hydratase/carnithine racemase